ncbi:MAG: hypothetical protein Q4F39_05960 [Bacteroidia bacterium]|nr:hypothetical protein [Bacteroidia bacterium]
MAKCNTGTSRIPKYISDGTVTGINDIGCIILPDGSHFNLAVFIKDAECGPEECEELIALIALTCYNRFSSKL